MLYLSSLMFTVAAFGLVCSAQPLEARTETQFNIYAYGTGISGLRVFYADGVAKIGIPTQSDATDIVPIYFTVSESEQYTWLAHPAWSGATGTAEMLYMAESDTSEVGFCAAANSGKLTNVWWSYGRYVMVNIPGASFYADPVSGASGWYTLSWSTKDQTGAGKTLVTLRTIAPSSDSTLT